MDNLTNLFSSFSNGSLDCKCSSTVPTSTMNDTSTMSNTSTISDTSTVNTSTNTSTTSNTSTRFSVMSALQPNFTQDYRAFAHPPQSNNVVINPLAGMSLSPYPPQTEDSHANAAAAMSNSSGYFGEAFLHPAKDECDNLQAVKQAASTSPSASLLEGATMSPYPPHLSC